MTKGWIGRGALTVATALFAAAATSAQSVSEPPLPSADLPPDLARVLTEYEAAWQAKDAAVLARLFTEDGFVLSSGTPPVRGRAAIEQHYTGQGGPLSLRALAFATQGPLGYIIGGFAPQKGEPDVGKFTLTLRRDDDGRWLIVSDMDNGNSRPAAAATPIADVKVTQKSLQPLCLDGAAVEPGERRWRLSGREHAIAFTMRSKPRSGVPGGGADPGVAVVRFTPEAGHKYEVEVRAPATTYSTRTWERGNWKPVVRDRTVDRIVSGDPEWSDAACPRE